jgi:maleate cis-trans isomerase
MSIVERLERELGKPVLANNAVSLWAGLRLLKTGDSIPGLRPAVARSPDRMNLAA